MKALRVLMPRDRGAKAKLLIAFILTLYHNEHFALINFAACRHPESQGNSNSR